jgi:hypothetical protein
VSTPEQTEQWREQADRVMAPHAAEILQHYIPEGKVVGHEFKIGNYNGQPGKSCGFNLTTQKFKDFADGTKPGGKGVTFFLQRLTDKRVIDLLRELEQWHHIPEPKPKYSREDWVPIISPESVYKCDLSTGDPILPDIPQTKGAVAGYPYVDSQANLINFRFRVNKPDGSKIIYPLVYAKHRVTGREGWRKRDPKTPFVLYNLLQVETQPKKIFISAGEKCTEVAKKVLPDWVSTTWQGGEGRPEQTDWDPIRKAPKETRIVLWPDKDDTGQKAVMRVAALLDRPVEIVSPDPSWPEGYDIADLVNDGWDTQRIEKWIDEHSTKFIPEKNIQVSRPEVDLTSHDTLIQVTNIAEALQNLLPEIFYYESRVVRLRTNTYGMLEIPTVSPKDLIAWAALRMFPYSRNGDSRFAAKLTEVAARGLLLDARKFLPVLKRVSEIPVYSSSGVLLDKPGYDPVSKIFVQVPKGYSPHMSFSEAIELINDYLCDFKWRGPADLANALSLPITAIVRDLITGATPMWDFSARYAGTGKSLAARTLVSIITAIPAVCKLSRSDEEVRKAITTHLLQSPAVVMFDNVSRVATDVLEEILTARYWSDRLLGGNDGIKVAVRNLFVMTCNNPKMSLAMHRRTVPVCQDPGTDHPERRSEFRHPDLDLWVDLHRGPLVSAWLALVKEAMDRKVPPKHKLGGYPSFSQIVGGIMAGAGIEGFLSNLEEDWAEASTEDNETLNSLTRLWARNYRDEWVYLADVAKIAEMIPHLEIKRVNGRVSREALAWLLRSHRRHKFGEFFISAPRHSRRGAQYQLTGPKEAFEEVLSEPTENEENPGF